MTRRTSEGYVAYAAALKEEAPASPSAAPPLIVPAGRAFELVYNSCHEPMAKGSLFSRLFNHIDGVLDETSGHPSPLGTYLTACTFVASMLRQSPVGLAWAPNGVSDAQRDQMQMFAQRAAAGE